MTKIYVNYNTLKNEIIKDLNTTLNKLNKAIYNVGTISIPYDFEYASYIKKIFDENLSTYTKLNNKKIKIEKIISDFKTVENQNISSIDTIKNITIYKRKNMKN